MQQMVANRLLVDTSSTPGWAQNVLVVVFHIKLKEWSTETTQARILS